MIKSFAQSQLYEHCLSRWQSVYGPKNNNYCNYWTLYCIAAVLGLKPKEGETRLQNFINGLPYFKGCYCRGNSLPRKFREQGTIVINGRVMTIAWPLVSNLDDKEEDTDTWTVIALAFNTQHVVIYENDFYKDTVVEVVRGTGVKKNVSTRNLKALDTVLRSQNKPRFYNFNETLYARRHSMGNLDQAHFQIGKQGVFLPSPYVTTIDKHGHMKSESGTWLPNKRDGMVNNPSRGVLRLVFIRERPYDPRQEKFTVCS